MKKTKRVCADILVFVQFLNKTIITLDTSWTQRDQKSEISSRGFRVFEFFISYVVLVHKQKYIFSRILFIIFFEFWIHYTKIPNTYTSSIRSQQPYKGNFKQKRFPRMSTLFVPVNNFVHTCIQLIELTVRV